MSAGSAWSTSLEASVRSHRRLARAAVEQLSDQELAQRPWEGGNSVGTILQHVAGNLRSRWTDYLTTDGEKPWRDRDREFSPWAGSRDSLLADLDVGFELLLEAIRQSDELPPEQQITIRGEPHSVPEALTRSAMHLAYHVGQVLLVARCVHQGEWTWLSIAPGKSDEHNQNTWGSAASRAAMGIPREDELSEGGAGPDA